MFYLTGFTGAVGDDALEFTPDGRLLLSAGADHLVHVWDVVAREPVRELRGHTNFVTSLCLIPGTTRLASASWDDSVRIWDYTNGKNVEEVRFPSYATIGVGASPDGQTLAIAGGSHYGRNSVRLVSTKTWQQTDIIGRHNGQIGLAHYTPDGKYLITGSADRFVRIWDATTGEERAALRHTHWIQGQAVHGATLAVAAGRRVTLWSLPTETQPAQQVRVLEGYRGTALAVAFSPDGRLLATGGKDGAVRVWDMELGRFTKVYRWKVGEVNALRFAPDGMTVVAAGEGKIVVWDVD